MLRREAVLFLQEIIDRCRDATLVNFVVLRRIAKEPGSEADNFELHFKADVSDETCNIIESVAEKHKLSKAYKLSSFDPTYTTPSTTAGAEYTSPPVVKLHISLPVAASKAYTLPSSDPK